MIILYPDIFIEWTTYDHDTGNYVLKENAPQEAVDEYNRIMQLEKDLEEKLYL